MRQMNLYKICFLQDHPKDIFFENYSSIAMLIIFNKMWRNLRGLFSNFALYSTSDTMNLKQ